MADVGLCGLGNMGNALARRLSREWTILGFDVDRRRASAAQREHGVHLVDSPVQLCTADTVLLSLPAPKVSLAVISEVAPAMRPGSTIVETSTVTPGDVQLADEICGNSDVRLVDAAILSGVAQMAAGTTTLLVGGRQEDVDVVEPVLSSLTSSVVRFGGVGSGMAAKVINNAVAHAVMVVLSEAGAMAAATGVPRARLAELLSGGDGGLTRPLTHRFVERVLHGDYDGGMPAEAARKDSTLALAVAQESQVPLFAVQAAHTVYELAEAEGLARLDYSAIATLWERWTGRKLADEES